MSDIERMQIYFCQRPTSDILQDAMHDLSRIVFVSFPLNHLGMSFWVSMGRIHKTTQVRNTCLCEPIVTCNLNAVLRQCGYLICLLPTMNIFTIIPKYFISKLS